MSSISYDVAGTGFTVLDRLYLDDRMPAESLGGSCGNVLISLAMLNRTVAPILSLGQDLVGEALTREFDLAGATTAYIFRHASISSPVIAQMTDSASGQHQFSFVCPETNQDLPRYTPIDDFDVRSARAAIGNCQLFYTDRLSASIVDAMEIAWRGGATVYFEPSSDYDDSLLSRALAVTSILKFSSDRLGTAMLAGVQGGSLVSIVTHGASGLELRQGQHSRWCAAVPATKLMDTCGSGDMLSVGLIDWMIGRRHEVAWDLDSLMGGVIAGQNLAAANCGFAGARGLFHHLGADVARHLLDMAVLNPGLQLDLFNPSQP